LDELKSWVLGVWQVCLHLEASEHPLIGDVWSHGGILEDSADHAKLWVPVGKSPTVKELLVVEVLGLIEDLGGERVVSIV